MRVICERIFLSSVLQCGIVMLSQQHNQQNHHLDHVLLSTGIAQLSVVLLSVNSERTGHQ